jgi:hypothetical protein
VNILTPRVQHKRLIYGEDKLQFGLICMIANGFYFLKEPGYVYHNTNPEDTASGIQQTAEECLRQLRYVERALKYLYMTRRNISYRMPPGIAQA